jgi:hypothetical protein
MKKLLLLLLMSCLSTQSQALVGDVYFCNMTKHTFTSSDEFTNDKLRLFKFKWEEDNIVFSGAIFVTKPLPIRIKSNSYNKRESFWASDGMVWLVYYDEGLLRMAILVNDGIESITADCSAF